jgi:nucleoside phosphorylase
MSEGARSMRTVVILTALRVEYEAVRSFLVGVEQLQHPAGTVYEHASIAGSDWHVVIAETGVGNNIAAIETSRALDSFRPDVTMFVGVAGGVENLTVGDVVAADYVYGYESAKMTEKIQSRIKTFGSGYPLVQRARAVSREDRWHTRIGSEVAPQAHIGPIASGEQVIAGRDTPTHVLLETYCGDILAVEMEGWGFLFAAHTNGDVPAIVIRGISDLMHDKDASDDYERQETAARHAAAFAFELLETLDSPEVQKLTRGEPWHPIPH